MKQNDFYEVDGCMDFIPVTINETYADGVGVIVSDTMRDYRLLIEQVYRFPKVKEPQKVTIPKFVAEWIGYCKFKGFTLLGALDPVSELGVGLVTSLTEELRKGKDWAQRNQETFARAWLDGFEVEQEKLYTVEIPNPNNEYIMNVLIRLPSSGKIALVTLHKPNTSYLKNKEYQLTESEIKEDFEWAWDAGFAKEAE